MEDGDDDLEFDDNPTPRLRSHRSGSMTSPPPLPPPDFNPPAQSPSDPFNTVSPPSLTPSSSSPTLDQRHPGSLPSIQQQIQGNPHDVSIAAAATIAASSIQTLRRPPAIARISNESMGSISSASPGSENSSTSTLSAQSDGGEHLAEAREVLLHGSGESSRRESTSAETPPKSAESSFEVNIINPTPPQQPIRPLEPEAGPSRPRRSLSPPMSPYDEGLDQPAEHAWDSVWPAPGSVPRQPFVVTDPTRSHFPTAPVSPFITPAFSPAIIPTTSIPRRPPSPSSSSGDLTSPTRSNMKGPARDSRPGRSPVLGAFPLSEDNLLRRRGSLSSAPLLAHSPPKSSAIPINASRHQRSFSASSPLHQSTGAFKEALERLHHSSSLSPPQSPGSRAASMAKSTSSDSSEPSSPTMPPLGRKPRSRPGSSKGQDRLADISSQGSPSPPSPPPNKSVLRPRGRSMSSLRPSPRPGEEGHPGRLPSPGLSAANTANPLPSVSSSSLPPISLPPAVVAPPRPPAAEHQIPPAHDSSPVHPSDQSSSGPTTMPSPLFAPLSRPAMLRRALSDFDTGKLRAAPPLNRSSSTTIEMDKSPKRSADISSPVSPQSGLDSDVSRVRKSPRRSPIILPALKAVPIITDSDDAPPISSGTDVPVTPFAEAGAMPVGDVSLVDEGDVLPNIDFQMDVTFDDEGLNTLERIFLLSKSEFPFHRAYVARVLGDLLAEVDPCESVEYVLPLLSGFSLDEDESVKEAFASELHRILWYFYSTCRLVLDEEAAEEEELAGVEYKPFSETVTITSEGVDVVSKAESADVPAELPLASTSSYNARRDSIVSGPSTGSSAMTAFGAIDTPDTGEMDTPGSTVSVSSQGTLFSPGNYVNPYSDDFDPEKGWAKDVGPLVDRPPLAVNFFTPLLGSLLLNPNPTISESVRNGVVNIVGRLRSKLEPTVEVWGAAATQAEVDERRTFASQNGPHSHDLRPFNQISRNMVETELLEGIIVGMGQLSTEMPEGLFTDEEGNKIGHDDMMGQPDPAELFQEQLIAEATAGRATSMNLIGSLCTFYEPEEVVQAGFVDEVLRSGEGDVSVRAEGAVALSCLVKIVPLEKVYDLIPLFELFLEDPTEHVKQSVCLALPAICKRLEDHSYRRDFAVHAVSLLAASSDDVRCAVLEMLGEIIYVFDDDTAGPPQELLDVYMEDLPGFENTTDGDWDVVAAFNFPGVALTLGPDRWPELRELYKRLQDRAGDKIMRILAASLHELAKILYPNQVEADLMPVYKRCLTCDDEVRERVYEHVDILVSQVPSNIGFAMFQELARAWHDGSLGGWRAREQLAVHLPSFLQTFHDVKQGEQVLDVLRHALLDPFAAVRDGVTKGIPDAYAVLGDESPVAIKFRDMLLELSTSKIYRRRLTFVRCLREFIRPPPNQHAFENFFVPHLGRLSTDVVDIRLGLAQAVADLFVVGAYYGEETGPVPKQITELAKLLHEDESADIRDTLRKVDRARLHKGKGVPYAVSPTEAPDRSLQPDDPISHRGSQTGVGGPASRPFSVEPPHPERRPSAEVAAKMDSMQIGSSSTSKLGSTEEAVETGSADISPLDTDTPRVSQDPFSLSFAHATSPPVSGLPQ